MTAERLAQIQEHVANLRAVEPEAGAVYTMEAFRVLTDLADLLAEREEYRQLIAKSAVDGVYRCTIPGNPVPKARARVFTNARGEGRALTPARTKAAEQAIGWALKLAWRHEADATSLFGVRCRFVFSRTAAGETRRVDGDNVLKNVLDAGNGVVWQDDQAVIHAEYDVEFGDNPRAEIEFWIL